MSTPIFDPHPHPILPSLADLRDQILILDRKRKPKWGFRLAKDLIVQIQPWNEHQRSMSSADKATLDRLPFAERRLFIETIVWHEVVVLFRGQAIIGREDVNSFDGIPGRGAPWSKLEFTLRTDEADNSAWIIKLSSWRSSVGDSPEDRYTRLRAELQPERFVNFTPELMLRPACLYCGKALTDPVSMARWIGPECAGTSSLRPLQMFDAEVLV